MKNNGEWSCYSFFAAMLAIVFITLKLTGTIDWSWIWVLSPIWISVSLVIVAAVIIVITYSIIHYKEEKERKEYEEWKRKNGRL